MSISAPSQLAHEDISQLRTGWSHKRKEQTEEMDRTKTAHSDFDQHVERCLSMVLHHDEVQQMAEIVKKLHAERQQAGIHATDEASNGKVVDRSQ